MVIDSPCCSILIRDLQLLLVIQASVDPRTEAELGIGTFSVRKAGSPGFQSHTEHLTQKHPDSVWWRGSGGWKEGWGHPGLPVIDAGRQFFPAGAWLCLALLDMPPAPSPNQSALSSLPPFMAMQLPHPHSSQMVWGVN